MYYLRIYLLLKGKFAVDSSSSDIFLPLIKLELYVTGLSLFAKYAPSQVCICLGIHASAILPTGTVKTIGKLPLL